ncbi:MAG: hypothetical protein PHO26_10075 [Dehalococcoidia bacterium]|nr:hypothetical protein [Dehalococcoidia bacterium]
MRTLSSALALEQKKATRKPLVKLEVATYGHPAAVSSTALQFSDFAWERLTSSSDATTPAFHSLAVPADGSVCRVRMDGAYIKYQRVTSPSASSDWSIWSSFGTGIAGHPIAIVARSAQVIAFADDGTNLYRKESSDSGASWGSWTSMANTRPCERGLAAAYKSNGDLAVVHASDVNDPKSLYIDIRSGGTWSSGIGQISGEYEISALALYHNGDWNIMALLLDGDYIRLARGVYGDGHSYTAGVFSGWEIINSYRARITFSAQMHLRQFRTGRAGRYIPTYYERVSAVNEMRAVDNLGVDDPFLVYDSGMGALMSFAKDNKPWFYRLRAGTDFKDSDWYKAIPLDVTATYGLALACDSTYLYAAAPNQVWRTVLPGSWTPPSAGGGAGTNYSIPAAHVLGVKEKVEALSISSLDVVLDNSKGSYDSIGSGSGSLAASLKRGSQVTLSIGYRTSSNLLSEAGRYYIESLGYRRKPGENLFTIHCIDAWGLLEKFSFNRPVEWNSGADTYAVYDLIGLILQAVGGSLSYKSRSSYIMSIYPRLTIHPGQNGAAVLRNLLSYVPDVIFFVGLTGYIVYPQASDSPTYWLRFPK